MLSLLQLLGGFGPQMPRRIADRGGPTRRVARPVPNGGMWANGGIAGLQGPELGVVGDQGPEAIVPLGGGNTGNLVKLITMLIAMLMSKQGQAQPGQTPQMGAEAPQAGGGNSLLDLLG